MFIAEKLPINVLLPSFILLQVAAKKLTLKNVTDYIVNVICKRSDLGYNYEKLPFRNFSGNVNFFSFI
jgi:pyrophosphate--fructose-6-phosphate 1-phosphotransferase